MKKLSYSVRRKSEYFLLFLISVFLIGCEEVIDLNLDSQAKQIVIDAAIDWEKGTDGKVQKIKMTYTTDYYDVKKSEIIEGAEINITTYNNENFKFVEKGKGVYVCDDFVPKLNKDYILSVKYDGEHYTSKARMLEVPVIKPEQIKQTDNVGLDKDGIELRINFDANPKEENSFAVKIKSSRDKKEHIYTIDDKFISGGKFFFVTNFSKEELQKGDIVDITLYRISSEYKQILDLLSGISLNTEDGGGPPIFSIPSRIFGNIVNDADVKKNPLGAFRVSQYSSIQYIVK